MSDQAILAHRPNAFAMDDGLLALAAELAEDECLSAIEALEKPGPKRDEARFVLQTHRDVLHCAGNKGIPCCSQPRGGRAIWTSTSSKKCKKKLSASRKQ